MSSIFNIFAFNITHVRSIYKNVILLVLCLPHVIFSQIKTKKELIKAINETRQVQGFRKIDTAYINLLNELGDELRFYKPDSSLVVYTEAFKNSKIADYKYGKSIALLGIGVNYSDKGDSEKAIEKFQVALETATDVENSKVAIEIQNNLGEEYAYMGNYAKVLSMYQSALEQARKIDYKKLTSVISENIASLYYYQEDYSSALIWYKKVTKINQEIGNDLFAAESMSNLASLYSLMGEYKSAIININKSIQVFEKNKKMDWLAYAYGIKGNIYLEQKKYTWAIYWYEQSDLLHNTIDDDRSRISILNGLAKSHLAKENESLSKKYALKAFDIATRIKELKGQKDCVKTLYEIAKKQQNYDSALGYHEVYKSLSDSLSKDKTNKSLSILRNKMEYEKQKEGLMLSNEKALAKQQYLTYVVLIILILFMVITFIIYRSIKIQKELNKELISKKTALEKKEEHLEHANQTKNRLFTIIGHDLKGPIGAFQGLLRLFKEGGMSKEEFIGFVPRLKLDIDHIAFTLNNLLSWGQTQMNGLITKPDTTDMDIIVEDNIALLSEIAAKKSIQLINNLEPNTLTWSDSNQINIFVRNLMSNALKFTPENGRVVIGSVEKTNHWEIYVRDNGVGMDKETIFKIFNKNIAHTTYGTENEKGTGLGLSLCKEMVEKNDGIIWVDSTVDIGSSFYFTIPKPKEEFKNTA